MKQIIRLIQKSIQAISQNGLRGFLKKAAIYIRFRIAVLKGSPVKGDEKKHFMDVLFINGCALPHPARYRVSHQREQLHAYNMVSEEVFYEELSLELIKYYRVFIFFRCPYTEMVGEFIKLAKQAKKTVLFDIDDLVVDTKYTDEIEFLKTLGKEEKRQYDDGVLRMQKVLCLCEGAITTTERLASELANYVPEVYINRNTASESMVEHSEDAIASRDILPMKNPATEKKYSKRKAIRSAQLKKKHREGQIRIGYFSGSISHNNDFVLIMPALVHLLDKYKNLRLYVIGELTVPKELKRFQDRIVCNGFLPWQQLPELIASVDINLAPLDDTIFNEAKSENKWVEAGLVKVPTVASNVGAMRRMIVHGETGLLCDTIHEWENCLERLITDDIYRRKLGEAAYQYARKNCTTISTGYPLAKFIRGKMKPNIAFVLPSLATSGGVLVAFHHALFMREAGWDVLLISDGLERDDVTFNGQEIFAISLHRSGIFGSFDKCVATLWSTVLFVETYPNIRDRFYLVQGYETDFLAVGHPLRFRVNQTYVSPVHLRYVTISKWCQSWLQQDYERNARYAPNGLDASAFGCVPRDYSGKIRILIEGNCEAPLKNVDESFCIANALDPVKFEVWYMCYEGKPKDWYRVDRLLEKVPYETVPQVYQKCHILLKTSVHESFSYPPLEMMSTGGIVVALLNDGNQEYIRNGENCLTYPRGDIDAGVAAIERICNNADLRRTLEESGIKTALERDWDKIRQSILDLYMD